MVHFEFLCYICHTVLLRMFLLLSKTIQKIYILLKLHCGFELYHSAVEFSILIGQEIVLMINFYNIVFFIVFYFIVTDNSFRFILMHSI